jgi:hypothetical protein
MPVQNWEQTAIYRALAGQTDVHADAVRNLLVRPRVMPAIVEVLDLGGTMPKDFTLHDSAHSFRVAERMWKLIPESTKPILSAYELGLLLLSAYLHDIGMSPEFEKVRRHRSFLTERKEGLSEEEIDEFQKWIDDDPRTGELNIREPLDLDDGLVNYILSYYIRHKHNDWSGEWIRKHLGGEVLLSYAEWVDDLVLVCKSHHYGLDHLLEVAFDPRFVAQGIPVHLRYMAMCLRVADVMENDPERTPEVILSHREIGPGSLRYWLKDHQFQLIEQDNAYTVYARPSRAFLHKAVEETAAQIEAELKLCDELIRRKPPGHTLTKELKGYKWEISPVLKRDIQPKPGAYVYIQGAFRPNTAKILDMLGGHQLYGNAIWAYRELIQNAFDAVKEQIAWQIINRDLNPELHQEQLGGMTAIDLTLERREDGVWLICKDQGVGMTREIIEGYFLQSGISKRHEIKELERECLKKGFYLGRTGQFGIGVLSYFMLAEKIVITTRREAGTGYPVAGCTGWRFEINGTHDFGELRETHQVAGGTQIELKLTTAIEREIGVWDKKFAAFIKDEIVVTPCVLRYEGFTGTTAATPGWTNDSDDITGKVLRLLHFDLYGRRGRNPNSPPEVISSFTRGERVIDQQRRMEVVEDVKRSLAFLSAEGWLDDDVRYRVHIPYFRLSLGNSFFYLKEQPDKGRVHIQKVGYGHYWSPVSLQPNLSLKGIKIEMPRLRNAVAGQVYVYVEIDLLQVEESNLGVSRKELVLEEDYARELGEELERQIRGLFEAHSESFNNSYGILNTRRNYDFPDDYYWLFDDGMVKKRQDLVWGKIDYPAVVEDVFIQPVVDLKLDGQPVRRLSDIQRYEVASYEDVVETYAPGGDYGFHFRLGLLRTLPYKPYTVIQEPPEFNEPAGFDTIALPEEWSRVLLIESGLEQKTFQALNTGHLVYPYFDASLIHIYAHAHHGNDLVRGKLFPHPASEVECATFLVFAAANISQDKWIAYCEENPDRMARIFTRLKLNAFYVLDFQGLGVVGPNTFDRYEGDQEIAGFLPPITDASYYFSAKNL